MGDNKEISEDLCKLINEHYIQMFMTNYSDVISIQEQSYKNGLDAAKKIINKYFRK